MTRGQRIWAATRERRDTEPVSVERARLVTESFQETEGLPLCTRRAKAFEKIMKEFPIYIEDEQLLVGDFSTRPMAPEWFPELTTGWIQEYMDRGWYDEQVPGQYGFERGKKELILEICDYWKDKACKETLYNYIGKEEIDRIHSLAEDGAWVYAASSEAQTEKGWNIPDYSRIVRRGLRAIIGDIDKELAGIVVLDEDSFSRKDFLSALRSELENGILYAHRYADLAAEMAKNAAEPRKTELLTIERVCRRVPEFPAETFQESLQSMFFAHLLAYWDSRTYGLGFGRVDQYLYPGYKHDIDAGLIDRAYALELLECFRVKIMNKRMLLDMTIRRAVTSESHFHNCVIGGQTVDGKDAVNDLSFLWLEAAENVRTPHPTLSVRWHPDLNMDFAMQAARLCSRGMGFPAWFNDAPTIEYLLTKGGTLEECRDYAVGGCVLHNYVGKTGTTWPSVMNFGKVFELSLHNGIDPRTGIQVGPMTGDITTFTSYDQFVEAFRAQTKHFVEDSVEYINTVRVHRTQTYPDVFLSCMFDDCIKKGKSILNGGARYASNTQYVLPVGIVDVGNSLYAIRKLVFEDKSLSTAELKEALDCNFEGKEALRQQLWNAPKYGNDVPEVDYVVADLYKWLCEYVNSLDCAYGGKFELAPHSIAFHANMGRKVGALPSGRLAGTSLSDGAVSPWQGSDTAGPTAVINSAGRIDHVPIFGTLFNMRFSPGSLKTDADLMNLLSLIRTYFVDGGGKHIQFNVVDKATLIDAKEHPENHRDLIVRVAGYSALWGELNEDVHNELIARTENAF